MDYENFHLDRDDETGIARVTIDSTGPMNTLHGAMVEELLDLATTLGEDPGVRCIVLSGTDGFFGAGADLSRLSGDASDAVTIRRWASLLHDAVVQLHQAETPLITGVDGVAAGAGFSLAVAGDLVLLSDAARLEYAYPRVGLTGDGSSTFFLPRLVGLRRAKEIVLLDEPIDPERAVELGLATEVVPAEEFDERLDELAREIASGPTKALGATLRLLTESFDRTLEGQMAAETETIAGAIKTEDYRRGYEAFFEKEAPEFEGR